MNAVVEYLRDESLNVETLAILDDASSDVLEIQRALEFDDQDVELHMDTYCVVRSGLAHYGGVLSWALNQGTFSLRLESGAAEALQLPQEVEIAVSLDGGSLIRTHMNGLLGVAPSDNS